MSGIRHPNIVQFLGGTRDPQSGRPVLLMELIDESLTRFLEQSPHPVPYHVEVCLTQDIALAIAYLHSNQIIHRDLSSNNVLVLAKRKAKITDFGMSRIVGERRDWTKIPGTEVYMPPECFSDQPEYDNKMDIFSLGVLVIQILSRQFPKPTSRFITHSPGHARIVPETERRREHINLIDHTHPLRSLSLRCLETSSLRPSAPHFCGEIDILKRQERYTDSRETVGGVTEEELAAVQRVLTQQTEEVRRKDQEIREALQQLREREAEMAGLRTELAEAQGALREKEVEVDQLQGELNRSNGQPKEGALLLSWQNYGKAPTKMASGSSVVHGDVAYLRPAGKTQIYTYNRTTREWSELVECVHLDSTLVVIDDTLTVVGGRERHTSTGTLLTYTNHKSHEWEEQWPQMPHPRANPAVTIEGAVLVTAGGTLGQNPTVTVEILHTQNQQWQECTELPLPLSQPSVCIANERVILTGESEAVLSASLPDLIKAQRSRTWTSLATLPKANASCTFIEGQLIAIGGRSSGLKARPTNDVYKYDAMNDKWVATAPLSVPRSNSFLLSYGGEVLAVGGYVQRREVTDTIETAIISHC